jgi:mxaA protein
MRPLFKLLFGLSLVLLWVPILAYAAGSTPRIESITLRNFGYVIGDPVDYDVLVTVPDGYALETEHLPMPGPLNEWLDIRALNWTKADTQGETQYRLRLTYQIFKGVRQPEKLTIPALPIRFRGQAPLEVQTQPMDIAIAPIIPPDVSDENVEIRESAAPEPLPIGPHPLRFTAYLAGALAVLAILACRYGWLPFFAKATPPFARALRDLRKLNRKQADAEAYRTAVRLLHRALDDTAGFRLFAGELEIFLATHPAFTELRDELNHFFALSRRIFYTAPDAPIPADSPLERLETLCRRCTAAERRST